MLDLEQGACSQLFKGTDQTERGAAQAKGIAFAGGRETNAPNAHQRLGAFGHKQHRGGQVVWFDRGIEPDAILPSQGFDHTRGFLITPGIVSTHDALQLWKLAHHVGVEVGFGE